MTHASVPEEDRADLGVTDSLVRLSVGLEDIEDLIEDLDKALKAAVSHWNGEYCTAVPKQDLMQNVITCFIVFVIR